MNIRKLQLTFLIITILASILLVLPIADYQPYFSTGDHGRDLYAARTILRGDMPYKDFWWVYGPLMPYFYAPFVALFGINVKSIILGKLVLMIACNAFFYLTLSTLIAPYLAFLGALWFFLFNNDFFFTYNHIGGIVSILATTYYLSLYIQRQNLQDGYKALLSAIITLFIKINFGAIALGCTILTIFLTDIIERHHIDRYKKNFYSAAFLSPAIIYLIYSYFTHGLLIEEIRQCFPYIKGDQPYYVPFWTSFSFLFTDLYGFMTRDIPNIIFSFIVILCIIQSLIVIKHRKANPSSTHSILLTLFLFSLFFVLNLNEYLISGVYYRSFWSIPFQILILFLCLGVAFTQFSHFIKILFVSLISFIVCFQIVTKTLTTLSSKYPTQFMSHPRAQVYVGNAPQWIQTVSQTAQFLEQNLKPNELFLVMPYDPIYYFLADKKSPSRQLIFFEHIHITQEQEKKIITELEKNDVHWLVISNRAYSNEAGMGMIGKDYCPLLAVYLDKNFREVARFGDWQNQAGWSWNHGTKILRKL